MKLVKSGLIALSLLTLSACGGGGGSDSGGGSTNTVQPVSVPLSITVSSAVTSLNEGTSGTVSLSYLNENGAVKLSIGNYAGDFDSSEYTVTVDNTGNSITINMGDVNVDGDLSFTVTGTDNSKSDTVNVSVSVVNTSVFPAIETLTLISSSFENISQVSESRDVLERLNDLSVLMGIISKSTASDRMQSVDSLLNLSAYTVLKDRLESKDYASLYANGMTELEINEVVSDVQANLPLYSAQLHDLIVSVQESLGTELIASFPEDAFYVDIENQSVSRFWMNPAMGSIVDGKYSFNSEYAYLTAVLFPESQPCNQ
jgi:hypothetical protein